MAMSHIFPAQHISTSPLLNMTFFYFPLFWHILNPYKSYFFYPLSFLWLPKKLLYNRIWRQKARSCLSQKMLRTLDPFISDSSLQFSKDLPLQPPTLWASDLTVLLMGVFEGLFFFSYYYLECHVSILDIYYFMQNTMFSDFLCLHFELAYEEKEIVFIISYPWLGSLVIAWCLKCFGLGYSILKNMILTLILSLSLIPYISPSFPFLIQCTLYIPE